MQSISNCNLSALQMAARALKSGHLVAFPTETVYGLGADATNEKAVSRIYSTKGRPSNHPLIVHIPSIARLKDWACEIPEYAIGLAREFWPGPMTLILPRKALAKDYVTGGQNNIALRIPSNALALELLIQFDRLGGKGIAAPSANRFGAVSPTTATGVIDELGTFLQESDLILDGGKCEIGLESTIISCIGNSPEIIRPGAISSEMISKYVKIELNSNPVEYKIKAPGAMESHYAPRAKVILDQPTKIGDGFIALENHSTPNNCVRLAAPRNIDEFARDLYQALRLGDQQSLERIVVISPKGDGLAIAIRDRLKKASA